MIRLFYLIVNILAITACSYMAYTYVVEGTGLHPLLALFLVVTMLLISFEGIRAAAQHECEHEDIFVLTTIKD